MEKLEFESFCETRIALRKSSRARYAPILFGVEYMAPAFVSEDGEEDEDHEGFDGAACGNESDDGGGDGSDSGFDDDRSPANRSDGNGKISALATDDNPDDYVLV